MAQTQTQRNGLSAAAPRHQSLTRSDAGLCAHSVRARNLDLRGLAECVATEGNHLLAVIGFGATPALKLPCTFTTVAMPAWSHDGQPRPFEAWLANEPVEHLTRGALTLAKTNSLVFGCVAIVQTADEPLEVITERAYSQIFTTIDELKMPHLSRVWHYLPAINETEIDDHANACEHSLERYRRFSLGRHEAFVKHDRVIVRDAPAASALGTKSMQAQGLPDQLVIYFVASDKLGEPIENPRQVSAYNYPNRYGPRSPTFARASIAPVDRDVFYVSGTASIVGHATVHAGDIQKQTLETIENIRILFDERSKRLPQTAASDWHIKVYVRHVADFEVVQRAVQQAVVSDWALAARGAGQLDIVYLQADVCRSDLLVEIEMVCTPALAVEPA
jgi:chorismate lyase / 3-hydroxybenzoate synthase